MATSGSTAFLQTRDQIIRRAGRQIGAWESGEVPGADAVEDWSTALNAMVKEWQASGIHVWKESEASVFLVPGQTRYVLGPDTTDRVFGRFTPLTLAADAAFGSTSLYVGYGYPLITAPAIADFNSDFAIGPGGDFSTSLSVVIADGQQVDGNRLFNGFKIAVGDAVGVFQSDGSVFWTTVSGFAQGSVVVLAAGLPIGALAGAPIITYPSGQVVDRPLRILDARRYDVLSQQENSINMISRLDYRDMPNKFTSGYPNSIFYDPQLSDGVLWVWSPVPTIGTLLNFTYMRSIESFLNSKDDPDFPAEWINALTWNLAVEMAPEYGAVSRQQMSFVVDRAAKSKDIVDGFDREPESIFVGVNFGQSTR